MADGLQTALTFVIVLNLMLWFGQLAVININPESTTFFNNSGTVVEAFNAGGYVLNDSDPASLFPSAEASVSLTTGNIFTDAFTSIKNWFLDSTGLKYVFNILGAPYHMLQFMHLPREIAFGLGVLWYATTLLLLITFFWGGR